MRPLDADDLTRRAREAAGPDGRLALPKQVGWPIFPFETEGLRMQEVRDPELPEPPRNGEGGPEDCWTCTSGRGDGGAHLHIFLVARPAGMIQLKGMYMTTWMFALPALPTADWAAMRRHVAAALA